MNNEECRSGGKCFPAALAIPTKKAYDVRERCCLWKPGWLC